jgi:Protein of unknown function (DUF4235)
MTKILFLPFSVLGGLLAGVVGRKLFAGVWSLVDKEEPPDPKRRDVSWQKLLAALVLEGAIFRAVRGAFDHGSRQAFSALTNSWPGEKRPEPS